MATTRFGIYGGIDQPFPVQGPGPAKPNLVTRMGVSGGITRFARDFSGKAVTGAQISFAAATHTALPVVDASVIQAAIAQATETDSALSVSPTGATSVTAVNSIRGVDIASANETLQINVVNSAGITAITVNGVACSLVQIINATEVSCICPLGFDAAYGSVVDLIVDNGTPSPAYSVTIEPPGGFVETDFTVAYAGLNPNSPFADDITFQNLVVGDSCVYESTTTPGGNSVTMAGDGEFTIGGTITAQQTFDYYIWDASDNTPSPTIETITVQPGPVEALIGLASETDSAFTATGTTAVSGNIGQASETNSAFPVVDASLLSGTAVQTTETDSALPVTGGPQIVVSIGQATSTSTAQPVADASTPTQTIGQAVETDSAFAVIDITAVSALIGQAVETNSALPMTSSASLESIVETLAQIQASLAALQLSVDGLTSTAAAQLALINDLYTRYDLNQANQNTYADDGSTISNSDWTLTKTDNGNGTFTVNRS